MKLSLKVVGLLVAIVITLAGSFAIGSSLVSHDHASGDVVSHGAPTDANGCHYGPSGYHCH